MKHLHRMTIIFAVSFLGEVLHALIPAPIPASIYGLVLMLAALALGVIPLEKVRTEGRFLIDLMPVMFIPALVGVMDSWGVLQTMAVPVLVIMVVSTFVVMGVSACVTQAVIRRSGRKEARK